VLWLPILVLMLRWLGGRSDANRSLVWLAVTLINRKKNHMNLRLGDDGS
jgi:hypothetical protein